MKIEKTGFGKIGQQEVSLFSLSNDQGMIVKIATYGATITSIEMPDKNGVTQVINCGFDTLEGYFSKDYTDNAPYFGSTVGRYSSRIKDGKFSIEGTEYKLAQNNGPNCLHGGIVGFDKKIWDAKTIENKDAVGVAMTLASPHMEEGFPGNLDVEVTFLLNNENDLAISYKVITDQTTPISLTNHTYFNLSGFTETIANHKVTVDSDAFLEADTTGAPTGNITKVAGDPADLRKEQLFQSAFNDLETGFEHYFLFDDDFKLKKVAAFRHAASGRGLDILTTEPGMLLYSGFFTSDALKRENGDQYGRYRGFCCETHRYPDGPNIPNAPKALTHPGTPYVSQTIFRFYSDIAV